MPITISSCVLCKPGCCPSPTNGNTIKHFSNKSYTADKDQHTLLLKPHIGAWACYRSLPVKNSFSNTTGYKRHWVNKVELIFSNPYLLVFQWYRLRRRHRWAGFHRHALFWSFCWCCTGEFSRRRGKRGVRVQRSAGRGEGI